MAFKPAYTSDDFFYTVEVLAGVLVGEAAATLDAADCWEEPTAIVDYYRLGIDAVVEAVLVVLLLVVTVLFTDFWLTRGCTPGRGYLLTACISSQKTISDLLYFIINSIFNFI